MTSLRRWFDVYFKCQIDGEDFFKFCGLLRKHELYLTKSQIKVRGKWWTNKREKKFTEKESYLMKNQLITTLGGKFLGWNFEVEFWGKYWHTSMYPLCNQSCLYSLVLSSTHRQTIGIYRVGHKGPKFLNHVSLILN